MSDTVIETTGLTKEFIRDEFHIVALRDVNLQVQRGEFIALMGPSLFPLMPSSDLTLPLSQSNTSTVGLPGQKALLLASFMPPAASRFPSGRNSRLRTPPT